MVQYQILKISFFITLTVLAVGCNPSKFQTNTTSSRSQEKPVVLIPSVEVPTETEVIPTKIENTCELQGKTMLQMGEVVAFSIKSNFDVPKNAVTLLSGNSFGIEFTSDAATSASLLYFGLKFQNDVQAGIHKRQIHIIDENGKTLCASQVLKIEFVGSVAADQTCRTIGGKIEGTDRETCSIESWNFYREMSARHLVSISTPAPTTGALNMTNPAATYCDTVGVYGYDLPSGGNAVCLINKNKLHRLLTQ